MVWADLACTALVEVGVKRYIYIDRYIPRVNVNTTLDSRDVRPLSYVVLAVTPAVTMDNRSSLLLLYLHKVEQTTRNYSGAYRLLPVRFGLRVQGEPSNPTRPWRPLQEA